MPKDIYLSDELVNDAELEELTDEERIAVLKGIKDLLGPGGENWGKSTWFGVPYIDGPDGEAPDYEFHPGDETRGEEPERATKWCLLGAAEEVGYRLGITAKRVAGTRFGPALSLAALLVSTRGYNSVYKFNDAGNTSWNDIEELLDERLAQLEGASS